MRTATSDDKNNIQHTHACTRTCKKTPNSKSPTVICPIRDLLEMAECVCKNIGTPNILSPRQMIHLDKVGEMDDSGLQVLLTTCRESKFSSKNQTHSQLRITPVPGDLMLSSGFLRYLTHAWYIDIYSCMCSRVRD